MIVDMAPKSMAAGVVSQGNNVRRFRGEALVCDNGRARDHSLALFLTRGMIAWAHRGQDSLPDLLYQ